MSVRYRQGNRGTERPVTSSHTGPRTQGSRILLEFQVRVLLTWLPWLRDFSLPAFSWSRGEELRLTLRYHFCSMNLLSSVYGRNEVCLEAHFLRPRRGWGEAQGGHPEVYVARIFTSLINMVDFHFHVFCEKSQEERGTGGLLALGIIIGKRSPLLIPEPPSNAHCCLLCPVRACFHPLPLAA